MYGFGMRELGFYYLDGGLEDEEVQAPNFATMSVLKGSPSAVSLENSLCDLINDQWD
jgi:hypothetical protein